MTKEEITGELKKLINDLAKASETEKRTGRRCMTPELVILRLKALL